MYIDDELKEVRKYLLDLVNNDNQQIIGTCLVALEKQVPKEILWNDCICPICKEKLQGYEKYCPECGQQLNWN